MHPIAETIPCVPATCGRAFSLLVRSFHLQRAPTYDRHPEERRASALAPQDDGRRRARRRRGGALAALAAALLWPAQPALADFVQQGPKLVANDAVGNAQQGNSVAVSDDGNTAIVGGPFDNNQAGAAWVFTRSGGVWSQQGPKLVGTGGSVNAAQGFSAAVSADGNT